MKRLSDYIMVIDDVLTAEYCSSLIKSFEDRTEFQKTRDQSWEKDYRSFSEINFTEHEEFEEHQKIFYKTTNEVFHFYKQKCDIEFFPTNTGFEDARMKKYCNNDKDQFGWHTDVGDYVSAKRFLVMFYYLNTVEVGGETIFNDKINDTVNLTVRPKAGRIVVFPPMWMYPHKGCKPVSESKYIVSTYAHYM